MSSACAWIASEFLGDGSGGRLRSAFLSSGPLGIMMLCVVTMMYPAELTMTMLATELTPSELDAQLADFEGRKVRVVGLVDDWGLADDTGSVAVVARNQQYETFSLPQSGTLVEAVGVVRVEPRVGHCLIAHEVTVLEAARAVVADARD